MDGVTVAERIKTDPDLETPIIVLTSAGRTGDAARCRALGISGYLTKPVMGGELLEAIRAVFEGITVGQPNTFVTLHSLREERQRLRLLLAEDNPVNRSMIARMLEKRGHHVRAVEDGRQVLAALEIEQFDLILMDVQMPELDGFETTAAIREGERGTGRHIPILALTAHAMRGDRERCLRHGMDGYASKPIQARELFATIEELVPPRQAPRVSGDRELEGDPRIFDLQTALRATAGDGEVLAEAVRLYLDDSTHQLEKMAGALERGDARGLARAAHSMRGALAAIAAEAAAEAAKRLETMAADGNLEASRSALAALHLELQRLTPVLQNMLEAA
jgi:CheY-like chemotaxis protein